MIGEKEMVLSSSALVGFHQTPLEIRYPKSPLKINDS